MPPVWVDLQRLPYVRMVNMTSVKDNQVFTARIRRMGKVMFSQASVRSHPGEGGTPPSRSDPRTGGTPHSPIQVRSQGGGGGAGGGYPPQSRSDHRMGWGWGTPFFPPSRSDPRTEGGGYLPPPWSRSACTFYAAGGMPLAFTQEDFLVPFRSLVLLNFPMDRLPWKAKLINILYILYIT